MNGPPGHVSGDMESPQMSRRVMLVLVAAMALMLAAGIVWSWPAMQDDALIHLRYADVLLQTHRISYDGVQPSFGDSSLLYIGLLAVLRALTESVLLPRLVSSVAHAALFAGAVTVLWPRMRERREMRVWGLLLLLVLALPSAVRWLDDGMETPLVMVAAALLAMAAGGAKMARAWLVMLAAACVLLRVEMLVGMALAAGLMFIARRGRFVEASALLSGGCVGCAAVLGLTGHLLPDTALAKALGPQAWRGTLAMTWASFAGAMGFGMGLLALWLLTAFAAYRRRGEQGRVDVVAANLLFPFTLAAATVRGQTVPGIRYFAWTLLFSVVWNLRVMFSRAETSDAILPAAPVPGAPVAVLLLGVLALGVPVEARLLAHVFQTRAETLARLRAAHLERLRDLRVVAFDVGYIGYFTGAPVCDLAGLVNGRASAKLSAQERTPLCAATRPQVVFLNQVQMGGFQSGEDMSRWSVCGTYDFANLRSVDLHYLAAAPEAAARVCAATGEAPRPVAPLLPAAR